MYDWISDSFPRALRTCMMVTAFLTFSSPPTTNPVKPTEPDVEVVSTTPVAEDNNINTLQLFIGEKNNMIRYQGEDFLTPQKACDLCFDASNLDVATKGLVKTRGENIMLISSEGEEFSFYETKAGTKLSIPYGQCYKLILKFTRKAKPLLELTTGTTSSSMILSPELNVTHYLNLVHRECLEYAAEKGLATILSTDPSQCGQRCGEESI